MPQVSISQPLVTPQMTRGVELSVALAAIQPGRLQCRGALTATGSSLA